MKKSRSQDITVSLSDLGLQLAAELQEELGCSTRSELLEWLLLCQRFQSGEARALLANRRKRGERGAVVVIADDRDLPPEG